MKKIGFTLSEVLITLAMIGILVAITMPFVMQTKKNHEYKTGYKKAISTTNQALHRHYALDGLTVQDYISAEDLVDNLFKITMNTIDGSTTFTNDICSTYGDNAVFTTSDGMMFCVSNFHADIDNGINSSCDIFDRNPCTDIDGPNLWVDVNGARNPNRPTLLAKHPKDIFQAQIYAHKIVPFGEAETQIMNGTDDKKTSSKDKDNNNNNSNNNNSNNTNLDSNTPSYDDTYVPEKNPNDDTNDGQTGNTQDKDETIQKEDSNKNESIEEDFPEEKLPEENLGADELNPDDMPDPNNPYYDQYDPNKWPSWLDFLKWILGKIVDAFT